MIRPKTDLLHRGVLEELEGAHALLRFIAETRVGKDGRKLRHSRSFLWCSWVIERMVKHRREPASGHVERFNDLSLPP